MSNSQLPIYEHELQSLHSKNFVLYQLSSSRRTMSKLSRKRHVFADGTSLPFFYHGLKSSIEENSVAYRRCVFDFFSLVPCQATLHHPGLLNSRNMALFLFIDLSTLA